MSALFVSPEISSLFFTFIVQILRRSIQHAGSFGSRTKKFFSRSFNIHYTSFWWSSYAIGRATNTFFLSDSHTMMGPVLCNIHFEAYKSAARGEIINHNSCEISEWFTLSGYADKFSIQIQKKLKKSRGMLLSFSDPFNGTYKCLIKTFGGIWQLPQLANMILIQTGTGFLLT